MALALFACLTLAGCRHGASDWAAFVPRDTVALAGVRLDQLRATPLYRELAGQRRLPGFDQFQDETGIDPDRDLRELYLAYDGRNTLWIACGAFEGKAPGVHPGGRHGAMAFVNKSTALVGSEAAVRAALDRYQGGYGTPAAAVALAEALPGNPQVWAVTAGWTGFPPETLRQLGNAANADRILRAAASASLAVDLRAGLDATVAAKCRTEPEAANLAAELRGLLGLARASVPPARSDLLRALDGIQVSQAGQSVKLNLDIPPELARRLLGKPR